ncbi:hypothetical protein [Streptomyces sp. NPDC005336]|uniref:hypothetical protein n=1 Tax=unclassified Streptomyces TaxID=2593676 RepID=UPI0033BCE43D
MVGALVALVGSVTIWTVVDAGAMGEDRYPGRDGDGVIALITALVAAGLYVGAMVTRKAVLHAVGGVFSLITLVVAVLNLADPERLAKQVAKDESGASDKMIEQALKTVDVSSGPGIYITLAGALMALVFGVIGFMKARAAR